MSRAEAVGERVALVRESEHVVEEERPTADDLDGVAATFALEPLATRGIGDAPEPERKRRHHVERGRRGVRETHNTIVAAPSGLAQSVDIRRKGTRAHRRELVWFGVEPDVASTDEDREVLPRRCHSDERPIDRDGAVL